MLKYFSISFVVILSFLLALAGFRGSKSEKPPLEIFPDMDRQAKYHPQGQSRFFEDGRAARPVPSGTVPKLSGLQKNYEHLRPIDEYIEDAYLATGKMNADWGRGFPYSLTQEDMKRGQELYTINCQVCHGASGNGKGITSEFGMSATASLLDERIRLMAEGEIFNTITHGKNTMGPYGHKIRPKERWKVIAYVRALQLASDAPVEAIPADQKGALGL